MISVQIQIATGAQQVEMVRHLLRQYGTERGYDAALGNFEDELARLPGSYAPPDGMLLLAMHNVQPAGCVAYRRLDPQTCEMKRLFVASSFRGQGLGTRLISELFEQARKTPYTRMRLDSHPHMRAAIHLYQQHGFYEITAYNQNPTPGIRFFERKL